MTKAMKQALMLKKQGKLAADEGFLKPDDIAPGNYDADVVSVSEKESLLRITFRVHNEDGEAVGLVSRRFDLNEDKGAIMALKSLMTLGIDYQEDGTYDGVSDVQCRVRLTHSDDGQYVNVRGLSPAGKGSAVAAEAPEGEGEGEGEEPEAQTTYAVGDKVLVEYEGEKYESEVEAVTDEGTYHCTVNGALYEFTEELMEPAPAKKPAKPVGKAPAKPAAKPAAKPTAKPSAKPSAKPGKTPTFVKGQRVQFADENNKRIVGVIEKAGPEMSSVKAGGGEVWTVPNEMLSTK